MASNPPKLLIVEDDSAVWTTMVTCLEPEGYSVEAVASTREALASLEKQSYPIPISDIYLDERTGIDVLRSARRQNPGCAVILMIGRGSMQTVMAATEGGAFEYLAKPFEMAQMIDTIKRAEKLQKSLVRRRGRADRRFAGDRDDRQLQGNGGNLQNHFSSDAHRCECADRRGKREQGKS
jgi:DNA-binding NtrC family response regulator